ncbi:MAG: hypothetical protein ACXWL2_05285 [Candidatus Chromulinivorax sp.]
MKIKRYDYYEFNEYSFKFSSIYFGPDENIPWNVTNFFKELNSCKDILDYKNNIQNENEDKFLQTNFLLCTVILNKAQNLVFFCNWGYYDYSRMKDQSPEAILKMCLEDDIEYDVMTKDNFIFLIDSWIQVLEINSNFALLYQDENDWYDVIPFFTKQQMENFVSDHLQK